MKRLVPALFMGAPIASPAGFARTAARAEGEKSCFVK